MSLFSRHDGCARFVPCVDAVTTLFQSSRIFIRKFPVEFVWNVWSYTLFNRPAAYRFCWVLGLPTVIVVITVAFQCAAFFIKLLGICAFNLYNFQLLFLSFICIIIATAWLLKMWFRSVHVKWLLLLYYCVVSCGLTWSCLACRKKTIYCLQMFLTQTHQTIFLIGWGLVLKIWKTKWLTEFVTFVDQSGLS